ncbi:MAG: RNA polymerase sigma factor [Candidatus Poribacteria bacterium]|nr:RNA polymerase sigma factor [Candidatus Poribacteria bacterium]
MKNAEVELIQDSLTGNENAFAQLEKKYQKQVHALAWRKVGDFHTAEEITQDTFLRVYAKLGTLKDPQRFAGWLYRIAARQCCLWQRKKRLQTQPLEDTDGKEIEKMTYSEYVIEEQAKAATEARRDIAQRLLARLRESERTVVTLHYFGEMTCEEISRFLGVSASTVKSRLRRARHRLKQAEPMIREALEGFQIRTTLTESIMEKVSDITPETPPTVNPFMPWTIAASTVVLAVMLLGVGNQFLTRFQQPYDLEATSEMRVELIDAPIALNLTSKPDVRTQFGRSAVPSRGNGLEPDAAQSEHVVRFLHAQAKNVVLNDEKPLQEILSVFQTPTGGYQDYNVFEIDTTAFKNGGTLTVNIWIGSAEASGKFVLFASDSELSTEGVPKVVLTSASGIRRGKVGKITYRFEEGTLFKLGVAGNAFSGEEQVNSFLARIFIDTAGK